MMPRYTTGDMPRCHAATKLALLVDSTSGVTSTFILASQQMTKVMSPHVDTGPTVGSSTRLWFHA